MDAIDDRPVFAPSFYRAGKVTLSPSDWDLIIKTLETAPSRRTDRDLSVFRVLSSIPTVRHLNDKERQALFKVARLKEAYAGEFLFTQGSKAKTMYIVLRGQVHLLHTKQLEPDSDDDDGAGEGAGEGDMDIDLGSPDLQSPNAVAAAAAAETPSHLAASSPKSDVTLTKKVHVSVVEEIEELGVVAEQVLLSRELDPHKVAARAVGDCVCMVIRRDDYQAALKEHLNETRIRNVEFFSRVTLFAHWPSARLEKLALQTKDVTFGPDELIIRQGDPGTDLYLVKVGQVRQLRTIEVRQDYGPPKTALLEMERLGRWGFFGEQCTVKQTNEQPNSVQAVTNVVLTVVPEADFRDILRLYPSVRNDIKAYIDRRYPPDHVLANKVSGLEAWVKYKADVTQRISRKAQPASMVRFGRPPPLPHEPKESLVDTVNEEEDPIAQALAVKTTSSSTSAVLATLSLRKPGRKKKAPTDVEPGLTAIRQRYRSWQRTEHRRRRAIRDRTDPSSASTVGGSTYSPHASTRDMLFASVGSLPSPTASLLGESMARDDPAAVRARITSLLNELANRGPYNETPGLTSSGSMYGGSGLLPSSPSLYLNSRHGPRTVGSRRSMKSRDRKRRGSVHSSVPGSPHSLTASRERDSRRDRDRDGGTGRGGMSRHTSRASGSFFGQIQSPPSTPTGRGASRSSRRRGL